MTKPVIQLRDRGLQVSVWENTSEEGAVYYTTQLVKRYKDGEKWKDSTNLSTDDLLRASRLLQLAYDEITQRS